MSIQKKPGLWLGLATLSVGVWSTALWAAEQAEDTLEEVVVTAEKRETNLQKTAMSIQVYQGTELKQEGKKRIDEIMSGVVGVQAQDSQVGASFSVRGMDTGTSGPPGTNPGATVAVLIDGVYQSRSEVVRGGTLDVAQAEVMRGTQSTTIGASSLAGAVSLVSNQPVFDYQANGTITVGNYNALATEGVLNLPLTSDQAIRAAYSSDKRDGYLSSNAGNSDNTTARVKYRWQPSDDLNAVITIEQQHVGGNGVSAGVLTYEGYWENYVSGHTYDATMGYPPSLGHVDSSTTYKDRSNPWDDGYPADTWPMNPFRDTRITSYNAKIDWKTSIGTLTVTPSLQSSTFRSAEPPRADAWMGEDRSQPTQQIEVRLASPDSSSFQWMTGLYYYYTDLTGTIKTVSNPGEAMSCATSTVACYTWVDTPKNSTLTESAFADVTYPLSDALRLIGGLRYSRDEKQFQTSADNGGLGSVASITGPNAAYSYSPVVTGKWNALTYRSGVEWDFVPTSMAYLTYATGYQPGVANYDTMANAATVSVKNTTRQFTLGVKNRFLDNRLQANVELFQNRFYNRPFNDPTSITLGTTSCTATGTSGLIVGADLTCLNPNSTTIVMPYQQSRGADFEFNYLPTADDRIDLTFEYLDSTYGANPTAPTYTLQQVLDAAGSTDTAAAQSLLDAYNTLIQSYKGVTLQNSPKTSGNLSYEHTFRLVSGASLAPKLNVEYKDKYWAQGGGPAPAGFTSATTALAADSIVRQDAYELFNASTTWTSSDGKYTATGFIKNIANKAIQTNISGDGGVAYVSLGAPRTFGLTISASL
ncbi:MAG: TonB-dependent receptor [Steroidobacteraceae bacterium]